MNDDTFLSTVDWVIIFGYLLGIIAFGAWFGRGQKNTRDYFLGSRNMPWWGVGLSIVATETSALTFIGVPAAAYGGNLMFLQIVIGFVIARVLLAIFLVPHYFKGEIYSPYEMFGQAFGPAARRTAGVFFLIAGTLAAGVRVYVTCIPLELMLEPYLGHFFLDAITCAILLFVLLSLVYTMIGGIKAVVWTDAVQFFLLVGGGLFTFLYLPTLIDGGWQGALSAARTEGKLEWFNARPGLAPPYNIWMGFFGATVLAMATHGVDQLNVQRILTCRSVAEGRRALILSALIILPMFFLFLMVGILLWVYYTQTPPPIPLPEAQPGFKQNDYIFPIFILTNLPPAVKGFLIVGILSAAMSSVSSALSALASVSTMDLLKGWMRGERTERFFLECSRWSTLFWAVMLILVALSSRGVTYVLDWAFSLNGLTNGAMLGGLLLVLTWQRGRACPIVAGMIVSLGVMIGISQFTDVAWPWFTLIGTMVMAGVAWGVRLMMNDE